MNRDERSELQRAIKRTYIDITASIDLLVNNISKMKDIETMKLENIPNNLYNSAKAESYQEAINLLDEAEDIISELLTPLDDFLNENDIEYMNASAVIDKHKNISTFCNDTGSVRSSRLQLLITPKLHECLKKASSTEKKSINQIVNEAIYSSKIFNKAFYVYNWNFMKNWFVFRLNILLLQVYLS